MEEVAQNDIKYHIRNGECAFKSINVVKNDFDITELARIYIKERNDKVSKSYTNYCCILLMFVFIYFRLNTEHIKCLKCINLYIFDYNRIYIYHKCCGTHTGTPCSQAKIFNLDMPLILNNTGGINTVKSDFRK